MLLRFKEVKINANLSLLDGTAGNNKRCSHCEDHRQTPFNPL